MPTTPNYVNTGGANFATGSSVAAPLPPSRVVGNLMLLVLHTSSSVTVAPITGWTGPLNSSGRTLCYWRIIDGTESTNPTVSWTGGSTSAEVHIYQYHNVNTSAPFGGNAVSSGTGTALSTGNITTTTDAALIIFVGVAETASVPTPSGITSDDAAFTLDGFNVGHKTGPTPAALTGGASATLGSSSVWTAYLYELKSIASSISGTLGATEAPDVASFSASVADALTLGATEAPDVVAIAAQLSSSGQLAATEAPDVVAITATSSISGTLAATEAPDVASFSVALSVEAVLGATEAPDVVAIAAQVVVAVALQPNEDPDTVSITAEVVDLVTLSATEAPDVVAFAAGIESFLALSATEAPDVVFVMTKNGVRELESVSGQALLLYLDGMGIIVDVAGRATATPELIGSAGQIVDGAAFIADIQGREATPP